jgi:hypothetical protein
MQKKVPLKPYNFFYTTDRKPVSEQESFSPPRDLLKDPQKKVKLFTIKIAKLGLVKSDASNTGSPSVLSTPHPQTYGDQTSFTPFPFNFNLFKKDAKPITISKSEVKLISERKDNVSVMTSPKPKRIALPPIAKSRSAFLNEGIDDAASKIFASNSSQKGGSMIDIAQSSPVNSNHNRIFMSANSPIHSKVTPKMVSFGPSLLKKRKELKDLINQKAKSFVNHNLDGIIEVSGKPLNLLKSTDDRDKFTLNVDLSIQ